MAYRDCTTEPLSITYSLTSDGLRQAIARWPVSMAMHAHHLPTVVHEGVTYVPFTGDVVAPYRNNVTPERPTGYYLQYRALRRLPSAP